MNQPHSPAPSSQLEIVRAERLKKIEELRSLGYNPYPAQGEPTAVAADIINDYSTLQDQNVTVAGRIMSWREFGALAFGHIQDASGRIQLYLKKDELASSDAKNQLIGFDRFSFLDVGDFVEAEGIVTKTQKGEISILVKKLRLLSKSIRPLPDKWHGMSDTEERFRRRYLDMTMNPEIRERFVRRSKFWSAVRDFLNKHQFSEVNIPVLEHVTGGADANPFVTHYDALDQDFYLRISHELPLKRLLGAGFERVYDIGPRFRNEGISDEHLPEHVAMEWYWAYANDDQGMDFTEELFKSVMQQTYGTQKFEMRGFSVDLDQKWPRKAYADLLHERFKIDIFTDSDKKLTSVYTEAGGVIEKGMNRNRIVDSLWKMIRKDLGGPLFVVDLPKFMSPLAKSKADNPELTGRFFVLIAGSELANGYSELNDPVDQLNRFLEQQAMRDAGDAEAQMLDIDYVEMLEYGMPPACGFGMSERVFWFFEGVTAKEGVPFPQLRQEVDEVTKLLYPQVKFQDTRSKKQAEKLQKSNSKFEKKV